MRGLRVVQGLWALGLLGAGCSEEPSGESGGAGSGAVGGSGGAAGSGVSGSSGSTANGGTANGGQAGKGGTPSSGGSSGASAGGAGNVGSAGGPEAGAGGEGGTSDEPISILVFSRTEVFRHASIANGVTMLTELGSERGWQVEATEDPAAFTDAGLAPFDVVVFLSTTGDVLASEGEGALERFVSGGKGWVGIHSASDTEYDWAWYGGLVGTYFEVHPPTQAATIIVEDSTHAATLGLPAEWRRTDEWYSFASNPRASVNVLLSLDESSYDPEAYAMGDHPIAWNHEYSGGRAFYTALGHTPESYGEPLFRSHVAGGIRWAAGH